MFERRSQPILSKAAFIRRQAAHALSAFAMVAGSLLIGIIGYHVTENLSWLDSFVNASMILGGMGPVNELKTEAGKIFAGCYALFAGIVFLLCVAILFAPAFHRFMHRFHLEDEEEKNDKGKQEQPQDE
jgi:hypothetical protein